MNIKRYDIWSRKEREYVYVEAKETFDGEYVKWSDVEKLIALRTAEAAECELMRKVMTTEKTPTGIALHWPGKFALSGKDVDAARNTTNAARRAANI